MKTIKILFAMMIAFTTVQSVNAQKAKTNTATNQGTTVVTNNYTCPMHPDVVSDKPGKCSKCGMDLTLSPKEKMKMEVMKTYSCPMHPNVTSNKPGKCSECGMALTRVKAYSCPMHPEVVSNKPGKCTKCGMDLTEVKNKPKAKKG